MAADGMNAWTGPLLTRHRYDRVRSFTDIGSGTWGDLARRGTCANRCSASRVRSTTGVSVRRIGTQGNAGGSRELSDELQGPRGPVFPHSQRGQVLDVTHAGRPVSFDAGGLLRPAARTHGCCDTDRNLPPGTGFLRPGYQNHLQAAENKKKASVVGRRLKVPSIVLTAGLAT